MTLTDMKKWKPWNIVFIAGAKHGTSKAFANGMIFTNYRLPGRKP